MDTLLKNKVLHDLAILLEQYKDEIIEANRLDLDRITNEDEALVDRLKVDESKVKLMIDCVKQAEQSSDPEGKTLYQFTHENGLLIENKTVPFGRILIIYESRPDVTIEAAVMAFKAGNKIFLKGGKEAVETNSILVKFWHEALEMNGIDKNFVNYLDLNRTEMQEAISENLYKSDLIIPRGGEQLIDFVKRNSNIPVLISGRGNNFCLIDENCDFEMATKIIINGKSRISVCNALDKVLIHKNLPDLKRQTEDLIQNLIKNKIEVIGFGEIENFVSDIEIIQDKNILQEEFLASKILIMIVDSLDEGISVINENSGGHSATIITNSLENAKKFQTEVDCAAVYHNASTRFTDGGQFGISGEIAISTQKLHFRGPLGINELTTNKWFVSGNGQIR